MGLLQRSMQKAACGLMVLGVLWAGSAPAQQAHTLLGVNCAAPPASHDDAARRYGGIEITA